MFYVPLTTKGKFFEVAANHHTNQSTATTSPTNNNSNQVTTNNNNAGQCVSRGNTGTYDVNRKQDYVYRISDLVINQASFPLHLKTIYAPSFVDIPGKLVLCAD